MPSVSRKRTVRASLENFTKKSVRRRSLWASSLAGVKSVSADPSLPMELEQALLDDLRAFAGGSAAAKSVRGAS